KLRFEREYPVPPLGLPAGQEEDVLSCESARLFVDRVRDVRPDFAITPETGPHIAAICTRLEGLPLAIELAASRMKMLTLPPLRGAEVEGEARLDRLQPIREYALGELRATPEAELLRARHAAHYIALADSLGPSVMGAEQRRSIGRLLTEAQNIRAALGWAVE